MDLQYTSNNRKKGRSSLADENEVVGYCIVREESFARFSVYERTKKNREAPMQLRLMLRMEINIQL